MTLCRLSRIVVHEIQCLFVVIFFQYLFQRQTEMEDEQLFGLRWKNYYSNLASSLYSLYKDRELCDVTLSADGKSVFYFKELVMANPGKETIIILHGVDYNALCSILEFMYQGEVTLSEEDYQTFMRVAEMLKLEGPTNNNSSSLSSPSQNEAKEKADKEQQRPENLERNQRVEEPLAHQRVEEERSPLGRRSISRSSPRQDILHARITTKTAQVHPWDVPRTYYQDIRMSSEHTFQVLGHPWGVPRTSDVTKPSIPRTSDQNLLGTSDQTFWDCIALM